MCFIYLSYLLICLFIETVVCLDCDYRNSEFSLHTNFFVLFCRLKLFVDAGMTSKLFNTSFWQRSQRCQKSASLKFGFPIGTPNFCITNLTVPGGAVE